MPEDAILIVCGGLLQVPAVSIARELGLKVIVTDANPQAPAMRLADEPVVLDIYDVAGHEALVERLGKTYRLRGVFTEGADVEVTVAAAAARAGLPGIPVQAARNTKSKVLMRRCFDRHGIPNPEWGEASTLQEAQAAALRIGFPLVVKAVDNAASRGTTRVSDANRLEAAFKTAAANSTTGTALLEKCLQGEEQSVEILFDAAGGCHHLNVVDRIFQDSGAYAIELGHVNPSGLPPSRKSELFALAESAARATGVNLGAFKADTIITPAGPRILEVTARLSGGFDCQYTTPLATGRNFIRAAMMLALGEEIEARDLEHQRHLFAAAWAYLPSSTGTIRHIAGVEEARRLTGVREIFLRLQVGDELTSYENCAQRAAFVIATGNSRRQAIDHARQAAGALKFETVTGHGQAV